MTTLTQSDLDDMRQKAEQPFEKYAALAASIGALATHAGGISLIEWDNHLAQINAVIAHLTAEIDQAAGVIEDRNKEIADLISDLDTAKSNTGAACARIAELEAHPSAQFVAEMRRAEADVIAERRRQVEVEGFTTAHDAHHVNGELANAALAYLLTAQDEPSDYRRSNRVRFWPFSPDWWKPSRPRRQLVKAAALIIAEIERLDRACIIVETDKLNGDEK